MIPLMPRNVHARISLAVPVLNECETLELFHARIDEVFAPHPDLSVEFVFVDDGSTDETLDIIRALARRDPRVVGVELSRNFGKEAALSAGLELCTGDAVVPMDVDLQDPPEVILEMIAKWRAGADVVLGRRVDRSSDSVAKRMTARLFYTVHNKLADIRIPADVGDFRLMDRQVVDTLKQLPESRRFMKGLFAWAGYRTEVVEYDRPERIAGSTKFNGWKLWNFALEGITSFSTAPLRMWTYIGITVTAMSFLFALYIFVKAMIRGIEVPGYASLIVAIILLGGLQLIGIGVLGEYLGRVYMESKRRPVFVVRSITGNIPANADPD